MYLPDYPIYASNLTKAEKLVLLALKFHIGNNPDSYVSQGKLAKDVSMSRNRVIAVLKSLEEKGWIVSLKRQMSTNRYSLVASKFSMPAKTKRDRRVKPVNKFMHSHDICSHDDVKSVDTAMHNDLAAACTTILHKVVNITKNKKPRDNHNHESSAAHAAPPDLNQKPHVLVEENKPTNTTINVKVYEYEWGQAINKYFPSIKYVGSFTGKEYAMLKKFLSSTSQYDHKSIIDFIVGNWRDFTYFAKDKYGAYKTPECPKIDHFLYNTEAAINYYDAKTSKPAEENLFCFRFGDKDKQPSREDLLVGEMEAAWSEIMTSIGHPQCTKFSNLERQRAKELAEWLKKNNPVEVLKACLLHWDTYADMAYPILGVGLPPVPSVQLICRHPKLAVDCYKAVANS